MTTPRPDSRLGTDLGPYRIERVLGRGGMGVVYLAEQRELGRKVALKLLAPEYADDEAFRARFLRESKLAASIDHANIIPIYEAGEAQGTSFLAMRYVEGTDLDDRLKAGPLDPGLATDLLAQVAGALDAAHAAGLVHRDVKPANLLLADEGGAVPHVYLTDFGLTKKRASQTGGLTRAGSTLGTLEYMAPEQVEGGEVDAPADEYALACVAFQCLTGRVPFERDSDVAVAMAHLRDAPPSAVALRPELPSGVDAVLARGMAKDPLVRYETCAALMADLRAALSGALIATPTTPASPTSRRRPLAIAAVLGIGLVGVAGLALASGLVGSGSPTSSPPGSVAVASSTAAPSPTPSPTPAPTSTTFPTAREAAFIAKLPESLTGCTRTTEKAAAGPAGLDRRVDRFVYAFDQAPDPIVLACEVPGDDVDVAYVLWDGSMGRPDPVHIPGIVQGTVAQNPDDTWAPNTLMGWMAGLYQVPDGDCAASIPAVSRWTSGREERGQLGCRSSDSSGKAWLYWTDEQTRVYGWASAPDGDRASLYDWWKQTAPFILPPGDT